MNEKKKRIQQQQNDNNADKNVKREYVPGPHENPTGKSIEGHLLLYQKNGRPFMLNAHRLFSTHPHPRQSAQSAQVGQGGAQGAQRILFAGRIQDVRGVEDVRHL